MLAHFARETANVSAKKLARKLNNINSLIKALPTNNNNTSSTSTEENEDNESARDVWSRLVSNTDDCKALEYLFCRTFCPYFYKLVVSPIFQNPQARVDIRLSEDNVTSPINSLPDIIFAKIFCFLTEREVSQCGLACKRFRQTINGKDQLSFFFSFVNERIIMQAKLEELDVHQELLAIRSIINTVNRDLANIDEHWDDNDRGESINETLSWF